MKTECPHCHKMTVERIRNSDGTLTDSYICITCARYGTADVMGIPKQEVKTSTKTFKIVNNDMSDGYHTFDELYDQRSLLFINLCLNTPFLCTWKQDYETWFCLYLETRFGQISYHIPNKFLKAVEGRIKRDDNYQWDGHTVEDVVDRLTKLMEANI